jgi:hypothetical protein
MSNEMHSPAVPPEFEQIQALVQRLSDSSRGDTLALLGLLRFLEGVHREISEGVFQEALPTNRQALYALLKDIEANGGWPYIYRLKLQDLLQRLELSESGLTEPSDSHLKP